MPILGKRQLLRLAASAMFPALLVVVALLAREFTFQGLVSASILGLLVFVILYLRDAHLATNRRMAALQRQVAKMARTTPAQRDLEAIEGSIQHQTERLLASVLTNRDSGVAIAARLARLEASLRDLAEEPPLAASELPPTKEDLAAAERSVTRNLTRALERTFTQVEASQQLISMFRPVRPVPASRGWASSPDLLVLLVGLVGQHQPRLIVEAGSGLSTLTFALALRQFGVSGKVIALEHLPEHQARTTALLADHGLLDRAEVRLAPLVPFAMDGDLRAWYDQAAWGDLEGIDLLFVDGPPSDTGNLARYPALPLLHDRLSPTAPVVLDDMVREDEKSVLAQWGAEFPAYQTTVLNLEKGAALLSRSERPLPLAYP
jgi:predicted O-methyltransferase YrrM